MNKKGFTLIELLAVIVILAIIAVIAIPIVLNIISDLRKDSAEISMKNIEKAASLYFQQNHKDENIVFECSKGKCKYNNKELELNGKAPESGKILIDKSGNITYEDIVLNGFNCYKEHDTFVCDPKKTRKIYTESEIVINSQSKYNLFDYNIYGNSVQNETTLQYTSVGDKTINLVDNTQIVLNKIISSGGVGYNIGYENKNGCVAFILECKPNTTYTLSSSIFLRRNMREINNMNEKIIVKDTLTLNGGTMPYTFTTTSETNSIAISLQIGTNPLEVITQEFMINEYIQFEEGTIATEYEPYDKYKISIKVSGKNLFNKDDQDVQIGRIYVDGSVNKVGITDRMASGFILVKPNTTYSQPYKNQASYRVGFYDSSYKFIGDSVNNEYFFTTSQNTRYIKVTLPLEQLDTYVVMEGKYTKLADIPPYEPYYNVTANIYLDEPLRKLENKADYIDFKNGKVVRYIEEDNEGNLKVLSVPKEEKIELPEILLHKGINNIGIGTSIKPSKIELEYYKEKNLY